MKTIKQANDFLKSNGSHLEIFKGQCYFYFLGVNKNGKSHKSIFTTSIKNINKNDLIDAINE